VGNKELTPIAIGQAFSRLGALNSRTQLSLLHSTQPIRRKLIESGLEIPPWAYLEEAFGSLDCSKQQLILKRVIYDFASSFERCSSAGLRLACPGGSPDSLKQTQWAALC